MKNTKTLYGLPEKVIFCKTCTLSNQRPHSVSEFKHTKNRKGAVYLNIDKDGICDACKMSKLKGRRSIGNREKESCMNYVISTENETVSTTVWCQAAAAKIVDINHIF